MPTRCTAGCRWTQCLAAVEECGAPIVSVCGGEPLIYPEIGELVGQPRPQRKHVYLCTNGLLLEKKLRASAPAAGSSSTSISTAWRPRTTAWWSAPGVFAAAVRGILDAKAAGFQVCTNTTIYRDTDMHEIVVLFEFLDELGVDGFMISPAFGYEAVRDADPQGGGAIS